MVVEDGGMMGREDSGGYSIDHVGIETPEKEHRSCLAFSTGR